MIESLSFEQIFTSYNLMLVSVAYKQVGCKNAAEDLVQDTFLKFLKKDPSKIKDIRAYLIRSVKNACINYKKSFIQNAFKTVEPGDTSIEKMYVLPGKTVTEEEETLWSGFVKMMQNLSPAERAVLLLKDVMGMSYDDLGEMLGKSSESLRQLLCRARKNLVSNTPKFKLDLQVLHNSIRLFRKYCTTGEISPMAEELKKNL